MGGRIRLRQPAKGYRAGIDPVFLAAACPAGEGDAVLDLGCGVGTAMLCLAARVPDLAGGGIELQPGLAALAVENVAENPCASGLFVLAGDISRPPEALLERRFDHILANPPYFSQGEATASPETAKAVAHVLGAEGLSAWARLSARLLRPRGSLTMVHRTEALADVLAAMEKAFGGILVYPLWPRAGEPASRILVQGWLGSRAPMRVLPGMALHGADGAYTDGANAVLREGAAISALAEKTRKR